MIGAHQRKAESGETSLFPRFLVQVQYRSTEPLVASKPVKLGLVAAFFRNLTDTKLRRMGRRAKKLLLPLLFFLGVLIFLQTSRPPLTQTLGTRQAFPPSPHPLQGAQVVHRSVSAESAIIFIGGVPRSGTTLMRSMLDAHPDIRCGPETHIIPRILALRDWIESVPMMKKRLEEAGVSAGVLDNAVRSFILEIIEGHGMAAKRLCNKDPFTLSSALYLGSLFGNARFLLMLRDGRAVAHSIVTRKVSITGYNISSYRDCLKNWNRATSSMYSQCLRLGQWRCLPVYYEQLVLHPKVWLERVLEFLEVPWNASVLHHQDFVGKPGGISLSSEEKSTDQVVKPVSSSALATWVDGLPDDVRRDVVSLAPILTLLGYDPFANPPNYSHPLPSVADNSIHFTRNKDFRWFPRVSSKGRQ